MPPKKGRKKVRAPPDQTLPAAKPKDGEEEIESEVSQVKADADQEEVKEDIDYHVSKETEEVNISAERSAILENEQTDQVKSEDAAIPPAGEVKAEIPKETLEEPTKGKKGKKSKKKKTALEMDLTAFDGRKGKKKKAVPVAEIKPDQSEVIGIENRAGVLESTADSKGKELAESEEGALRRKATLTEIEQDKETTVIEILEEVSPQSEPMKSLPEEESEKAESSTAQEGEPSDDAPEQEGHETISKGRNTWGASELSNTEQGEDGDVSSPSPEHENDNIPTGEDDQAVEDVPQEPQPEELQPEELQRQEPQVVLDIMDGIDTDVKLGEEYDDDEELPWGMYRDWDQLMERRALQEEEEWPASEEEEDYVPPKIEDLPDLYDLMGTLEEGESDLVSSAKPHSLFERKEQAEKYHVIEELKLGLAEQGISEYDEDFEKRMEEEILMIGNISLEEVQDEERRLRDEHIAYQQQEAKIQRARQEDLLIRAEDAKKRLFEEVKRRRKILQKREDHLMQRERLLQNRLHRSFRTSENHLLAALKSRKGEVKTMYGDLHMADGEYGGSKGRRWKVDWNRTPQPIQIKLKCLRGVKDKLPGGRYVLMVSLYDRLGGHVLKWSNLKGQQWGGATLIINHDGEFFNIEMKIDQSVFTVCPPKPDVRPGMILVFEMFILRGAITATDRVVGWGCFPVSNGDFDVVEGKYKCPFLRGDMDPEIETYVQIEKLMADDLENWLCNLYFEVVKLPRYMAGQKEYEVELQFSSCLLSYPNRTDADEEYIDGGAPIHGSHSDIHSGPSSRRSSLELVSSFGSRRASRVSMPGSQMSFFPPGTFEDSESKGLMTLRVPQAEQEAAQKRRTSLVSLSGEPGSLLIDKNIIAAHKTSMAARRASVIGFRETSARRESLVSRLTEKLAKEQETVSIQTSNKEGFNGASDESGMESDEDFMMMKEDEGFKPVRGKPGMYYKKHKLSQADAYHKKMFKLIPKTPMLDKKKKKKLTHLEDLDEHSFSVKSPWSNKGHLPRRTREKMQYMGRQFLAELGLSQWRSREFWSMLMMLVLTCFIRLMAHYGGQWIYLTALRIPINKFTIYPYTVNLNYQSSLLRTRQEIGMIVIGPFSNIILFCLLISFSWSIQKLFGHFPNIFSRFIMAYGINALMDPIWILIVDMGLQRYLNLGGDNPLADSVKLYWHFDRYEKNGIIGAFLTVFLYAVTIFTACTILYSYFLRVHNNGRLLDIYHRLHAGEDEFCIPFDLEISNEELNFVCKKAEQWRGEEGERRKTAVYDYIWEEENVDDGEWEGDNPNKEAHKARREITTHVSIHTIHLDGLRELYRHFLRVPSGAIIEVFGEMGVVGMDESIRQALMKGTVYQTKDSAMASRASLRSRSSSHASSITATPSVSKTNLLDVPHMSAKSATPV